MSGRAQKIAATVAAAFACIASAHAAELAGTTVRDGKGWSASLFVSPPPDQSNYTEPPAPIVVPPVVNAMVSQRIAKGLSLNVDVKNVFGRRLPSDSYLFQPAEPRGILLQLRKTW